MLLHSGSGLHRHEYSAPTSPTTTPSLSQRATLVRSAFSSPASRPLPTRYDSSIKPSLHPIFPQSTDIRRQHIGSVTFVEQEKVKEEEAKDTMSDDGRSMLSHEGSEATSGGGRRKRRKTPKATISYAIAHPAPTLRQKQQFVHLRPQLLLQLQRVSAATRPMPVLDVLPSAVFVPRLAKKFPTMFKGRGGLGPNDMLCVKSEDYGTSMERESSSSDSDEEGWASREVEAVICQARRGDARTVGQAEIVFSSGSKWTAVPISGSVYEFTTIDEHGLKTTARWVRRCAQRSNEKIPSTPSKKDEKFNFSIINPSTRRHPIIASLTPSSLDIPDTYSVLLPAGAAKRSLDAESISSQENESVHPTEERTGQNTKRVSESLRKLIQITGVWVALRQGWSPNFKYDDFSPCSAPKTPLSQTSSCRIRSVSLDYKTRHASTDYLARHGAETPDSGHGSFSSKLKRRSMQKSPTVGTGGDGVGDGFGINAGRIVNPKRSTSTGAAFMARVAARRAGTPLSAAGLASTVASDGDAESRNSPPRRAFSTTSLSNDSNISVVGGNKGKRVSTPSPLHAVEPFYDGDAHAVRPASMINPPRTTPPTTTLANASASAALSRSGSGKASKGQRKEKGSRWTKFTGLFKRHR